MKVAITTRTTSCLGKEFVKTIIGKMPEINEIWLIACWKEMLEKIAEDSQSISFKLLPFDLSDDEILNNFKEILVHEKSNIKLLIINAGIVRSGEFKKVDLKRQKMVFSLNSKVPIILTYMALIIWNQKVWLSTVLCC
ncbi:SDR family NAD(P)-dependent oxidoreductase [Mycoplasma sp. P36-A1]|uniref:SDR family NAD(P)-dependent oxidoreductase n=1 Tax=Mycoplasma sp. P36-A1 TaxID=3252900 RepID=UPI003C2AEC83